MNTLLQRLSDNNPHDLNDATEAENKSSRLAEEMLLLLSSRPRSYNVEHIPLVNNSILNYGVSDVFEKDTARVDRNNIMQSRIQVALQRFEPRLKNIVVSAGEQNGSYCAFIIEADTHHEHVRYRLMWDDVLSQFSLRD
ncbi:GPW/gp25 family protein [Serratia marcescens]|uniref:GPW/gp25 family protein n=1 Tax=Serratia marcescens TaxID=615 RepID=UPI000E2DC79B|nr:GPW/gp25 family protein [Serratia marcescens]